VIVAGTKLEIAKDIPDCIKREIRDFNRPEGYANAEAAEYTFQGETV
jgi:hypothetical protein